MNDRSTDISDMLLTTTGILTEMGTEIREVGHTPYPPEEELDCVRTCLNNLLSVNMLLNFNAIWLSDVETTQLQHQIVLCDALAHVLIAEIESNEND